MIVLNWSEILCPYEQAVSELIAKFNALAYGYASMGKYSPITSVEGRVKSISSILDKARRKNIPGSELESRIEDIAGIRIICQFVEDIAKIIILIRDRECLDMKIIEERDYVNKTKESGYRSYHIIISYPMYTAMGYKKVFAEIQIRTMAMNFWATIEHSLNYKYSGNIPQNIKLSLVDCAEQAFKLDKQMSTIANEIIQAQQVNQIKTQLIDEILNKIQLLYTSGKIEDVDLINKRFIDIYNTGDIEKFYIFKQQLDIIFDMYK